MCADLQPDVVLMNLMMPEMNGVETTVENRTKAATTAVQFHIL
jgi:CheY-like chemotaxis protein